VLSLQATVETKKIISIIIRHHQVELVKENTLAFDHQEENTRSKDHEKELT
jgi:hypothetical protein